MKALFKISIVCSLILSQIVASQEIIDEEVVARIKMEAFQNSKIMETLSYITDVYSPRIPGTPNYDKVTQWCVNRLKEWGIEHSKLESFSPIPKGWAVKHCSIEMIKPQYLVIFGHPKMYSPSTLGILQGEPVLVNIKSLKDTEKYKGKLKNKIILNGFQPGSNPHFKPNATRYDEKQVRELNQEINIGSKDTPEWFDAIIDRYFRNVREVIPFLRNEGIAALIESSDRDHGIIKAIPHGYILNPDSLFPVFKIAQEQFGRLVRIIQKDIPVELRLDLQTIQYEDTIGYNVIAELPGSDRKLKNEVVMIGAHLDMLNVGTGTCDNGASCTVMMEVMRIIKKLDLKPRRTIRMGLWSGEELGFLGSSAYVLKHYGDRNSNSRLPEHKDLSAYFNMDAGTGKIRGINLQGNEITRPIFEAYFRPFKYLGVDIITTRNALGTDHQPFNWVGLPGFNFIQDPIEYYRVVHSNMDVYEAAIEDDLKQAAAVIASVIYHAAMRDEKFPRKE
ncbi:hypothetical protein BVY01_01990 [bacterium I07]|nr:hypothetical protein BVY01_01990 [bacterium I07]